MTIQNNSVEVLREVMKTRKWYGEQIERRKANGYKNLVRQGKLSHEKAAEILILLGWKKVKEEVWENY